MPPTPGSVRLIRSGDYNFECLNWIVHVPCADLHASCSRRRSSWSTHFSRWFTSFVGGFILIQLQWYWRANVGICFRQRGTHYTQLVGAFLISMGVIQAWVACAAVHAPVEGAGSSWTHVLAIVYRDARSFGPLFLMEYFYGWCKFNLLHTCRPLIKTVDLKKKKLTYLV